MNKPVYFDNAATTFPKPLSVYNRAERYTRNYAGNPGRGSHSLSLSAAEEVYSARNAIAELFSSEPERVSFTLNATYALNLSIKSIVTEGCHVIISSLEHNSVLRPTASACQKNDATYSIFEVTDDDEETIDNLKKLVTENTKAVICTHMSNIIPRILPIRRIGEFCKENGLIFIVDASQSAGIVPIDMNNDNIDILCIPGHKSLYGYQGVGAIIFGGISIKDTITLIEGGSGTDSIPIEMPIYLPDRFEAGTLPTPAISSLGEGVRWVMKKGIENIYRHEKKISSHISDFLKQYENTVTVYSKNDGPTLLFNIASLPSGEVSALYDKHGICVRAGLHCAPLAHKTVGTFPFGAVRASFGAFNTLDEADYFCSVTKKIINHLR